VSCTSGCTTTPLLMPERQPLTSLAEAALRSLALRADDHRRLAAAGSASSRGRHRPGHGDPLNGNAITDCVAVAESFTVSRLLVLCPAIPEHDVSSWKNRLTTWRRHGAVDLSSYGRWSALMGYAEVRNAMLHGLGRLTDQQLGKRRQEILVQIKAAGVHLNGPTVMLVEGDSAACADVCVGFVRFLDAAAPFA